MSETCIGYDHVATPSVAAASDHHLASQAVTAVFGPHSSLKRPSAVAAAAVAGGAVMLM